jgi:uncharacterized lipoprotein YmbA
MMHTSTSARAVWCSALLTAGVAILALSGCASRTPSVVLLSLPLDAPTTSAQAAPAAQAPTLVVRRVQIPEYLQSIQVRYRSSAQTLAEWPATRWAERLEVSLTRHLSQQLNARLPAGSVCDTACAGSPKVSSLQISYLMLDHVRPQGQMQAQVHWVLTPASGDTQASKMGQLTLSEPVQSDDAPGQAAAMARLNAQLASQIAPYLKP